jgi:hypothetical protein
MTAVVRPSVACAATYKVQEKTLLEACDMKDGPVHGDKGQGSKQRHTRDITTADPDIPLPVSTLLRGLQ